jgi:gamma-glutamyltranspeptidase/glutathione hydrolase
VFQELQRSWKAAHKKWGQNSWNNLFSEAIDLADNGFAVSPRLAALVARDAERLDRFSDTAEYFFPNEQPLVEGHLLTNPAYADLMRRMAKDGAEVIYSGEHSQSDHRYCQGSREKSGCFEFN